MQLHCSESLTEGLRFGVTPSSNCRHSSRSSLLPLRLNHPPSCVHGGLKTNRSGIRTILDYIFFDSFSITILRQIISSFEITSPSPEMLSLNHWCKSRRRENIHQVNATVLWTTLGRADLMRHLDELSGWASTETSLHSSWTGWQNARVLQNGIL